MTVLASSHPMEMAAKKLEEISRHYGMMAISFRRFGMCKISGDELGKDFAKRMSDCGELLDEVYLIIKPEGDKDNE